MRYALLAGVVALAGCGKPAGPEASSPAGGGPSDFDRRLAERGTTQRDLTESYRDDPAGFDRAFRGRRFRVLIAPTHVRPGELGVVTQLTPPDPAHPFPADLAGLRAMPDNMVFRLRQPADADRCRENVVRAVVGTCEGVSRDERGNPTIAFADVVLEPNPGEPGGEGPGR